MREIKFRAMTKPPKDFAHHKFTSEMVYGTGILYDGINTWLISNKDNIPVAVGMTKEIVIPETVGQYTGLKDKNGEEIYEGDIVQPATMGDDNIDSYRMSEDGSKAIPIPQEVKWGRYNGWDIPSETEYWEVIGNIHENPELLNG